MHECHKLSRFGRILLWIFDPIFHRTFLSLPSTNSGYGRRNREGDSSNNWSDYGATHDVHIDLLCASLSSIGQTAYRNGPSFSIPFLSFLLLHRYEKEQLFRFWTYYQEFHRSSQHAMGISQSFCFAIIQPFRFPKFYISQIA